MRAVYIAEFGAAENLEIREVQNPSAPRDTEVLVRVKAAGLNRADIVQRKGFYPAPEGFPERIPGLEFAGEIAAIGENVRNFKVGDRVFGITAGGAQAEFLLTEESLLAAIPENLSFVEAAAVPEVFITAYDAAFDQCELRAGETLLIHAVGSGVGLAALQLAKAHNIRTIGTSRTADKLAKCAEFGLDCAILAADDLIENRPSEFAAKVRSESASGKGADVILDLVGAKYLAANIEALAPRGRLISVGLTGGAIAEKFNLGAVLTKRARIIGTVLRSRPPAEKARANRVFIEKVLPLLAAGKVRANIDRIFSIDEVKKAHQYLESNESFGKVILEIEAG